MSSGWRYRRIGSELALLLGRSGNKTIPPASVTSKLMRVYVHIRKMVQET
jgi:hypothetical protein